VNSTTLLHQPLLAQRAPREGVAPRTLAHSAIHLARLRDLREAGVSSLEFSPPGAWCLSCRFGAAHGFRQLVEKVGGHLGGSFASSLANPPRGPVTARNGMPGRSPGRQRRRPKPNRVPTITTVRRNPNNFAPHSGVQAPTDSTKDSKQKELTEKERGRVESQILTLPRQTALSSVSLIFRGKISNTRVDGDEDGPRNGQHTFLYQPQRTYCPPGVDSPLPVGSKELMRRGHRTERPPSRR
jgi:hypothetical protein